MANGSLTMNGVSDRDLVIILEVKERHEDKLVFMPQQIQNTPAQPNQTKQLYNNVIVTWKDRTGLEAVMEILHRISPDTPCHHHK